jgi:alanyl-tRNA synthetase
MTSREARSTFLSFFSERGHRVVPSSPLVLPSDPTLLFANAGMNQFKDVFTGRETRSYVRAATSQKCLRVSGKHNDLEQVGRTPRHHTFFEMLGNFSFGDYFKEDAISFAWELITKVYGLPVDRLWVTIFGGSAAAGRDDEAYRIWKDRVGVRPDRILELGEKDNFWRMGDTGPCGPCSEIHYDLGEDLTSVSGVSNPDTDTRRYIEIWNLVFMQFEQHADGRLIPLPAPSIDTGMGLERITSVLGDKRSNYDTDLFQPILAAVAERAGTRYGAAEESDVSMRVIADHARALCFLVADGVTPSNDKRGYVLRRVLRRAIRHGRKLGIEEPFLDRAIPPVLATLGETYPEILAAEGAIREVARREEERFAETIAAGVQLLEKTLQGLGTGDKVVPGTDVFRLYDTFGLPLDIAQDIADERGLTLDMEGFEREIEKQRTRAQASWKGGKGDGGTRSARSVPTTFVGRERLAVDDARIVAADAAGGAWTAGGEGVVYLDVTPFYAEAGGQVGDTGWITGPSFRLQVLDTTRSGGSVLHRVRLEHGAIDPAEPVRAEVDARRRLTVQRNHTATHLLHAALREVVGTHVKQAGSLVAPDRLRFDFSHFAGLTDRQLDDIESMVNREVLGDTAVTTEEQPLDEALRSGAMALFGEKYGDRVRVVTIGDFSKELCGGIHTARTGEIGLFKLTQERGIASGTRRVEAVTGEGSLDRFREAVVLLDRLEGLLSVPRGEVVAELEKRLEQERELRKEIDSARMRSVLEALTKKAEDPRKVSGIKVLAERVDGVPAQDLKPLADSLRRKLGSGVVILGRAEAEKASILVAVTEDLKGKLPAGDLVREVSKIIGGGGGGRPDLAEAGGKDPARLDEAIRAALDGISRRVAAPA